MKILLVNATGSVSGAERVLIRFADEAVTRGDHVVLLSPPGALVQAMHVNVQHRSCRPLTLGGSRSLLSMSRYVYALLAASLAVLRLGVGRSIDVILLNNTLASPLAFLFGRYSVWLLHDVLNDDLRGKLGKKAALFCRLVVPVSQAAAAKLPKHTRVRVVLNGTPIWNGMRSHTQATTGLTVGCLAALTPWKGHQVLLEAFSLLKDQGMRLELAGAPFPGDEVYASELREIARKSSAGSRIHFLGSVDPKEVLQRWDMMVLPSVLPEALPLSILEAMSMGVPCIATGIGGSLEILEEIQGELVEPAQPRALADAISSLAGSPKRRTDLSDSGRDLVRRKYALLERTAELYSVVTGAGKKPTNL